MSTEACKFEARCNVFGANLSVSPASLAWGQTENGRIFHVNQEHKLRVFENRVLKRIFGAKRDEVTWEWRKLYSGELHNLYSSPDIMRQIKSRIMRWAGHVARMGEGRNVHRVLVGKPEGKDHLENKRVDGRMGSKWTLRRLVGGGRWSGFTWLRIGTVGGLLWMRWWTFWFWRHGVCWLVILYKPKALPTQE
jgi:hypothetical protein